MFWNVTKYWKTLQRNITRSYIILSIIINIKYKNVSKYWKTLQRSIRSI